MDDKLVVIDYKLQGVRNLSSFKKMKQKAGAWYRAGCDACSSRLIDLGSNENALQVSGYKIGITDVA